MLNMRLWPLICGVAHDRHRYAAEDECNERGKHLLPNLQKNCTSLRSRRHALPFFKEPVGWRIGFSCVEELLR